MLNTLNIVLVHPQIPPNTGNIARLCAGFQCTLHLIHPLGFTIDDRTLKRAGLDYWPLVPLKEHASLEDFFKTENPTSFYLLTTKSKRSYTSVSFKKGDYLLFGAETTGLSTDLLQAHSERTLTIPMKGAIRSFNLSSAVAMVVGEGLRQLGEV